MSRAIPRPGPKTFSPRAPALSPRTTCSPRALALALVIAAALLGGGLTMPRAARGDLQGQIAASQSAAATLKAEIATDSARIAATTGGLQDAQRRLSRIQTQLTAREARLRAVQSALLAARERLVALENRLQQASVALAANLVASYEGARPNVVSVVLEAHGFGDLLEKMSFLRRIGQRDAQVVGATRAARLAVSHQASDLATLEQRDRSLTNQILAQRNHAAALQAALLGRQIAETAARAGKSAQLGSLNARLKSLQARAAAQAAAAARAALVSVGGSANATVGGIAVNTGGMVQAPAGAPAAVAQVIAAGNAIATLPYVYGGGHGSFHDSAYDCSGSISYALAAAGLVGSPLDSTAFESWGAPGPGQYITVYANAGHAFMIVAGWRFDTVALGFGGTRWSSDLSGEDTSAFVARHPPGL